MLVYIAMVYRPDVFRGCLRRVPFSRWARAFQVGPGDQACLPTLRGFARRLPQHREESGAADSCLRFRPMMNLSSRDFRPEPDIDVGAQPESESFAMEMGGSTEPMRGFGTSY
jgi:hypothetical protein